MEKIMKNGSYLVGDNHYGKDHFVNTQYIL